MSDVAFVTEDDMADAIPTAGVFMRVAGDDDAIIGANPPRGWQPIETAPKDGTVILINNEQWVDGTVQPARWFGDPAGLGCDWQTIDGWFAEDDPTHWMPLPAPPVA